MNHVPLSNGQKKAGVRLDQIIKLAVLAIGGQGGGVLCGWIVDLAERAGYHVQATSIAGVAQRTGSTIYYLEMFPDSGRLPVFSLSPSEGDVDILLAAELMEAGRALMRGFITPEKTKVITSTHRQFATVEKIAPGDGIAKADRVMQLLHEQSDEVFALDLQRVAETEGTVISAAMFGALAGAGLFPFAPDEFRETIKASGRDVPRSVAAFERARELVKLQKEHPEVPRTSPGRPAAYRPSAPPRLLAEWVEIERRLELLPTEVHETASAGARKVVEFQDTAYCREYLDRLDDMARADAEAGGSKHGFAFTRVGAKYLANSMVYDDIVRVADLKTASARSHRIDREHNTDGAGLHRITEYFHPGPDEIVGLLPRRIGAWAEKRKYVMDAIGFAFCRGKRIRSNRIGGFLLLYLVAGLRRWRRSTLRHHREMSRTNAWIERAVDRLQADYAVAVETLRVQRLVKGYSDTHSRGLSKFNRVMDGAALMDGRPDAAEWMRRLIDAALKDEKGDALEGLLKTARSHAEEISER